MGDSKVVIQLALVLRIDVLDLVERFDRFGGLLVTNQLVCRIDLFRNGRFRLLGLGGGGEQEDQQSSGCRR